MSVSRRRETTQSTNTTTPTNPVWVDQALQDYTRRVGQVSNMDASALVPGASDLQRQAFQGASNLGGPTINLGGYGGLQPTTQGNGVVSQQGLGGGMMAGSPSDKTGDGRQIFYGGDEGAYGTGGGAQGGGQTGSAGGYSANVYDLAGQLAFGAGTAGANLMGGTALSRATGYNSSGQAQTQSYTGSGYTPAGAYQPQGYDPSLAASQGYTGAGYTASGPANVSGYDAVLAGSQGYNATNAGYQGYAATGYTPTLGQASGYQAGLIDPAAFSVGATSVGPMAQASSRNLTDVDLSRYMNTGLNDLVSAATADYDATQGQARARQTAQAAANGGVRNSNNAIGAAVLEGELSRARNTGLSGLRYSAYDTAANQAQTDLGREASTSQFNASQQNQGALAQAQMDAQRSQLQAQLQSAGLLANQSAFNQAGQFNAGAANSFGLANMDAANAASQFYAGAQNTAGAFGANAANTAGLQNAASQNQASQFGANAANTASLANAGASNAALSQLMGARNDASRDFAGRQDQASQFTAGAQNTASQFNSGLNAQTSQFNASAQNDARSLLSQQLQQAGLDYAGRQDTAGQFGAGAANDAARFGAGAFNTASLDAAGRRDQASQFGANAFNTNSMFNAGAMNDTNRFNAGQQDNALARSLQAAGLITNLGSTMSADNRANIGLQADLGGQQREIERQRLAAELDLLARQGDMYGASQFGLFNGSTSTGNSTTTQTGMNLDIMRAIQAGASIASGNPMAAASGISDVRAKTNILPIGQAPSGDPLYSFNYRDQPPGAPPYVGPMAQEVAKTHPEAVSQQPGGFLGVDYNALGVPSPQQQDAQRAMPNSLAPANDPLDGWQRLTADMSGVGAQNNQQQMARARTAARPRRGLFGGRMVG